MNDLYEPDIELCEDCADSAGPSTAPGYGPDHRRIIEMLVVVARASHALADGTCDDGERMSVDEEDFNNLSRALDALDELPEPGPNLWGTGPAKAAAILLEL